MFIIFPEKNNIDTSENFNNRVMLRVSLVCHLKKILSPLFLEICGFLALVGVGTVSISIKSVIYNSPSIVDLNHTVLFWLNAYINTEVQIKVIVVGMMLVGELILFNIVKKVTGIKTRAEGIVKMLEMVRKIRRIAIFV